MNTVSFLMSSMLKTTFNISIIASLTLTFLSAQNSNDKEYIFESTIKARYAKSYNEIMEVMADYYEGVEKSDRKKLDDSFHGSWLMRDNDGTDDNFIHIEDKIAFINRVENHGEYKNYASHRKIVTIELAHDQLALVRIDKSSSRSTTLFFLARLHDSWKIIDKLWVYREENYDSIPSYELLSCIRNLHENNSNIDKTFDSKLFMNNSYEVSHEPKPMNHEIKTASILGVYDRMAIVRTDYPILETTAFSVLFRLKNGWKLACERISVGN